MFSIITPSYNNSEWLRLCINSVADQNVPSEHIIQDGESQDGTLDWLQQERRIKAFVEPDRSMYQAINRGLLKSSGNLLSYLNCDEQYLPGVLDRVERFFKTHPKIDVLFGNAIVTSNRGEFICYRKTIIPHRWHTWTNGNLSIFTCATFFRRSIVNEGLLFDDRVRMVGDTQWLLDLIKAGKRMALLHEYTSIFTMTGRNIGFTEEAFAEHRRFYGSAPGWLQTAKPLIILLHRMRRLIHGAYFQKPFSYSIYTQESPNRRITFEVLNPTFRWGSIPRSSSSNDLQKNRLSRIENLPAPSKP
ncbi:MAG: glycosyltransferase [Verrucomicrobiota bacterium]|nr:glycosyltransferase [Verrucomicrobiota bacterium]